LVPLILPDGHPLTVLSGISADVALTVRDGRRRTVVAFDGALLCTHFGLSGPVVLDISRYWQAARVDDPEATLSVNWLPGMTPEQVDRALADSPKLTPLRWLGGRLVERLARTLCAEAGIDPSATLGTLSRPLRQALVQALTT